MPEDPLNPYVALDVIRTFVKVALANEEPTMHGYELILREIADACDRAIPRSPNPQPKDREGEG